MNSEWFCRPDFSPLTRAMPRSYASMARPYHSRRRDRALANRTIAVPKTSRTTRAISSHSHQYPDPPLLAVAVAVAVAWAVAEALAVVAVGVGVAVAADAACEGDAVVAADAVGAGDVVTAVDAIGVTAAGAGMTKRRIIPIFSPVFPRYINCQAPAWKACMVGNPRPVPSVTARLIDYSK